MADYDWDLKYTPPQGEAAGVAARVGALNAVRDARRAIRDSGEVTDDPGKTVLEIRNALRALCDAVEHLADPR